MPEKIHPIVRFRQRLQSTVDDFEDFKKSAGEALAADPVHFMRWGGTFTHDGCRGNIISCAFDASLATELLACPEEKLLEALPNFRDRLVRQQMNFTGASSTSQFHNAVDSAEAEFRRTVLEYGILSSGHIEHLVAKVAKFESEQEG